MKNYSSSPVTSAVVKPGFSRSATIALVAAISLSLSPQEVLSQPVDLTWTGGDATNNISAADNWDPRNPQGGETDTLIWDGTQAGAVTVVLTADHFNMPTPAGIAGISVTADQTAALTIQTDGNTTNARALRMGRNSTITIAEGAGPVTLGGTGPWNLNIRGAGATGGVPNYSVFTNNSSNTATIGSSVTITRVSTDNPNLLFSGTGNWNVAATIGTVPASSGPTTVNVLTKSGTGNLTFSGTSIHYGGTNVNEGTVFINGDHSGALGAVTVATAGTLGGNNTIGGVTTVNGKLAPGATANTTGILTFSGGGNALTLSGTAETILQINNNTAGTGHDQVRLTDADSILTYGGTLTLSMSGLIADGSYDLFSFFAESNPSGRSLAAVQFSGGAYTGAFSDTSNIGVWTATSNGQTFTFTESTGSLSVIPEPSSALLLAGVALVTLFRRRRIAFSRA